MDNPFAGIENTTPEPSASAPAPSSTPTIEQPSPPLTETHWKPSLPDQPPPQSKRWLWWAIGVIVLLGIGTGGYFAYSTGRISIPFLTPKADELFDKMVDSITEIKNAQYSVRLNLKSERRDSKATPLFQKKNSNENVNTSTTTNSVNAYQIEDLGTTVGLGEPDLGSSYLGALLSLAEFDELFQNVPGDVNFSGGVTIYVEANKQIKDADGSIKFDGTYTGGDISVGIDLEARKVGTDVFGIVNKFPSFFFIDPSAIKGKWVKLNDEDGNGWIEEDVYDQFDSQRIVNTLKTSLRNALKEKVFTVKRKLAPEAIAGVNSEHYLIALNPEKLPGLYETLINDRRSKGEDVKYLEQIRDELKKQEIMDVLKRIADNSSVEIWVDKVKGFLRQTKWQLTVVPPEGNERLQDKQFLLELQLTLEKVNQEVGVDKPSTTIDLDEASRLLTGISKEEQKFEKQTSRVREIRSSLRQYHDLTKTYPESIENLGEQLKKVTDECLEQEKPERESFERNRNANINADLKKYHPNFTSTCGYVGLDQPATRISIADVYTNKPYGYTRDGDDFKLTYEIRLPPESNRFSYQRDSYADGTNTATSKDESVEKETSYEKSQKEYEAKVNANKNTNANTNDNTNTTIRADSDYDGLNDVEEQTYKTDPQKIDSDADGMSDGDEVKKVKTDPLQSDTDGDGYSDYEEVLNNFNPIGPGSITPEQKIAWGYIAYPNTSSLSSNLSIAQNGDDAVVTWTTNQPTTGQVLYAETAQPTDATKFTETLTDMKFRTKHTMTFPVKAATIYSVKVHSCSAPGTALCETSVVKSFTSK